MTRFQALTNAVLDAELDRIRDAMGLRDNQKAELLRELTLVTAWVVEQLRAGRVVEARGPNGVERFHHPVLTAGANPVRVVLTAREAESLAALLDAPPRMSHELAETLRRVAASAPAPHLVWPSTDEEPPLAAEP